MSKKIQLFIPAIAVVLFIGACKGKKAGDNADSSAKPKIDSTTSVQTKSDTIVKKDTLKPPTDSTEAKVDTVSTTIVKHTVQKKSVTKKTMNKDSAKKSN